MRLLTAIGAQVVSACAFLGCTGPTDSDATDSGTMDAGSSAAFDGAKDQYQRMEGDAAATDDSPPPPPDDASDIAEAQPADVNTDAPDSAPHPISQYCGDAIRDPVTEECDDGVTGPTDPCTSDCRVRDVPVVAASGSADAGTPRSLGTAPHVSSGSDLGLAVVYTEPTPTPSVKLQRFGPSGTREGAPLDVGAGYAPLASANPAVAILPDGSFAVAWTDSTDGIPEVRLRLVGSGALVPAVVAHQSTSGLHSDPDLLWSHDRLVVAWTDLLDVKYREFAPDLTPLAPEGAIAATPAIESSVSLAPFADGWASAVRSNTSALESIVVQSGAVTWSTPPEPPGPTGDRPGLAALDDTHLFLLFTIGTDPAETGVASVGRLQAAVLDVASPGMVSPFAFGPTLAPYATATGLTQRRPAATRVGDQVYAAWEMASPADASAGEQVFVTRVALSPGQPNGIARDQEMRMPYAGGGAAWQSNVHLGVSTLFPAGALVTTWESASDGSSRAVTDLLLDFRPSPFVFLAGSDAD